MYPPACMRTHPPTSKDLDPSPPQPLLSPDHCTKIDLKNPVFSKFYLFFKFSYYRDWLLFHSGLKSEAACRSTWFLLHYWSISVAYAFGLEDPFYAFSQTLYECISHIISMYLEVRKLLFLLWIGLRL